MGGGVICLVLRCVCDVFLKLMPICEKSAWKSGMASGFLLLRGGENLLVSVVLVSVQAMGFAVLVCEKELENVGVRSMVF